MTFFAQLKRRNVIRVAGLYLAGTWLLVQVAATKVACAQETVSLSATGNRGAAILTKAQIDQALKETAPDGIKDTALRVVPAGGEYNVGISVVRRTRVNGQSPHDDLQHHNVTEVYQVIAGSGTLVTGGTMEGGQEIADPEIVKVIGPTATREDNQRREQSKGRPG